MRFICSMCLNGTMIGICVLPLDGSKGGLLRVLKRTAFRS
jgi:hypothetical protein